MSVGFAFGRATDGVASGLACHIDGQAPLVMVLRRPVFDFNWHWGSVGSAQSVCPCLRSLWANASEATISVFSEPTGCLGRMLRKTGYIPRRHRTRCSLRRLPAAIEATIERYGDRAAMVAG